MSKDQWSGSPANNDLTNYFKTGMPPSAVKTAGWDIMADTVSEMNIPTAGGTANALTVANLRPFGALPTGPQIVAGTFPALIQRLLPASANTGPATLAPDGLTVASIFANGAKLAGGEMQPLVPVYLTWDGTEWNLLNPAPAGRNAFIDPCCRIDQTGTSPALVNNTYAYGGVDLVQGQASGTAVSAGTLTQDSAGTVAAAATPYSAKISGLTVTGTGKVFFRRWIESRDSQALNGQTVLFSVLCRHDVGSSINAFLTLNKFQSQDSRGTPVNVATGSTVSVASSTDTLITMSYTFGASDGSNGIEVILEMDCGAVTTKDFWATDWQACIKTLAQKCVVPRFDDDLMAAMRYYEQSYEYGTAPGTTSAHGLIQLGNAVATVSAGDIFQFPYTVPKLSAPTLTFYSFSTGASGKIRDESAPADIAVTAVADKRTWDVRNNTGGPLTAGRLLGIHFAADARP